ncbi:MAG: DivIVA domain-containing protein [Candidatus Krumholzibacteriia bacterium]
MRLTPLDIRKQEFKKGMRGLDSDEVYAFLSTIADEYEAVLNDNKALRERVLELDDKVQEYRNMEKTLRDTLLTAERVTVESKDNARREANLIRKEAELEAEKGVRHIKMTAERLRQEIQSLRQQRDTYLSRLRMMVESHLKFLESAERDFVEEDREAEKRARRQASDEPRDAKRKTTPGTQTTAASAETPRVKVVPAEAPPQPPERAPGVAPIPTAPERKEQAAGDEAPAADGGRTSTAVLTDETSSRLNNILERLVGARKRKTAADPGAGEPPEFSEIPKPPAEPPPAAEPAPARPEPPAAEPAPEDPPGPKLVEKLPPAAPAPAANPVAPAQGPALDPTAAQAQPSEWSLDRLKNDILARSQKKDEKD